MIFNFTDNFQFSTRMNINNENIDTVEKTKLLGTVITNNLKWDDNTKEITRKANMRMCLLQKSDKLQTTQKRFKNHLYTVCEEYFRTILCGLA